MTLLLVEVLQLITCYHSVTIQVHYLEPVLYALYCRFVLYTQNKPHKVAETHLLLVLELFHSLRKDSFQSLSRQSIARIFRELFPAELEVVIIIEFPEFDIDDVEF